MGEETISRPLELRLTDKAEADLADLWAYIAGEMSERAADRIVKRIFYACARVREFPQSGAERGQFAAGLRVLFSGPYAIYYLHDERDLTVIRVLHGSRDAKALAEHGGFKEGL